MWMKKLFFNVGKYKRTTRLRGQSLRRSSGVTVSYHHIKKGVPLQENEECPKRKYSKSCSGGNGMGTEKQSPRSTRGQESTKRKKAVPRQRAAALLSPAQLTSQGSVKPKATNVSESGPQVQYLYSYMWGGMKMSCGSFVDMGNQELLFVEKIKFEGKPTGTPKITILGSITKKRNSVTLDNYCRPSGIHCDKNI